MTYVATAIFVFGVVGLFVLDREGRRKTSGALWLPIAWLFIFGSKPVSVWLGVAPAASADLHLEGSPFDRNVYIVLIAIALGVLVSRGRSVVALLRNNKAIVAFFALCLVSIAWSDFPTVAIKRWVKAAGDLMMVLIVLTERDRSQALRQVLASVGFVFIPLSILCIRYYPHLGRGYSPWEGTQINMGAAVDKNMLGMACLTFGLATAWRVISEVAGRRKPKALLVHGTVLAMLLWLFWKANSMTSLSCFLLATMIVAAVTFLKFPRKRGVVHLMVVVAVTICASALFLDFGGGLLSAMGRDPTLTGRTDLWAQLITMTVNPIVGAGFESFWLGERLQTLWEIWWWHPNEAHNGYLETYLNLGWVGILALALLMTVGYRNILRHLQLDVEGGSLRLGYFVVAIIYNLTEAATRATNIVWIVFLLCIMAVPVVRPRRKRPVLIALERPRKRRPAAERPRQTPTPAGQPVKTYRFVQRPAI